MSTSITTEMVEAAARTWWNGISTAGSWSSQPIGVKTQYRKLAKASLQAALKTTTDTKRARPHRHISGRMEKKGPIL